MEVWLILLILILVLIVSALPLHFAATVFGGKSSIIKVILVNFIVAIVAFFLQAQFSIYGDILAFLALLLIYKYIFDIGIVRAFLVWLVQLLIIALISLILITFFGISLFTLY